MTRKIRNSLKRRSRQNRGRAGQALVEFALILPVLLLVLLGTVEFGRMCTAQNAVTNAAREGVRRGVLATSSAADVQALVTGLLASAGINTDKVAVAVQNVGTAYLPGADVTVTVDYEYEPLVGDILGLGTSLTLTSTSVMRHE